MIESDLSATQVGKIMHDMAYNLSEEHRIRQLLEDTFAKKSPATLYKEELIVDDIPIFTRVRKKCLLFCSISVLQKYAKGLCLVNWFAAILKISKMRSVAMQTKCKPNQPVVVLVELLFIYI